MFIQGDLQLVFDALYFMGVIDPVLEMDWNEAIHEMDNNYDKLFEIIDVVNNESDSLDKLITRLQDFNEESLNYLAMEVAREFADFHSREELH